MTMATTSPTKRTRSAGIGGCGARKATCWRRTISSWGFAGIGLWVSGFSAVGDRVRTREHRDHARRGERGGGLDAPDPGVRVGRAHEARVGLARQVDVVAVAAVADEQARVVLAEDRLADAVAGADRVSGFRKDMSLHAVRFLKNELFTAILPARNVNTSQPLTSTFRPSAVVPVKIHSDRPRSPDTRWRVSSKRASG